jgi:hypothetical protein
MPIVGNGGIPIASCVGARYIKFGSIPLIIDHKFSTLKKLMLLCVSKC